MTKVRWCIFLEENGFYCGKSYQVQGDLYPCVDSRITGKTKMYKSRKTAENALKEIVLRPYGYVRDGEIIAVNEKGERA